jgi:two-component system chemotaxis response regulator CheB
LTKKIEVMVVEDSPTASQLLVNIISEDPSLVVVGQATDGAKAVQLARRLKPHVISMDIHMPVMNGLDATREIMRVQPTPIVVVSASLESSELDIAFNAIHSGALAVVPKPPGPAHPDFPSAREELVTTLRLMADVAVVTHRPPRGPATGPLNLPASQLNGHSGQPAILGIAASTGGPGALENILSQLPSDFAMPIVIVQHISQGFEAGLADWLNRTCPLQVGVAYVGQALVPGRVLVAPSGMHLRVSRTKRVVLDPRPGPFTNVPAADVMLQSLADVYGGQAVGVVLTGMGSDGAVGLRAIRDAGGITLAQDEATSAVFGMPKEAITLGGAEHVVPIRKIAPTITALVSSKTKRVDKHARFSI